MKSKAQTESKSRASSPIGPATNGRQAGATSADGKCLWWDEQAIAELIEINAALNERNVDGYWQRAMDLLRKVLHAEATGLWLFPRRSSEAPLVVRSGEFTRERLIRVGRWEEAFDDHPAEEFLSTNIDAVELGVGRRNEDLPIVHVRLYSEGVLLGGASFIFAAENLIQPEQYDDLVRTTHLVLDPGLRRRQLQLTQSRLDQVSLVAQVSQQLNSTLDLEIVLQETTELTASVLEAEASTLFLTDERRSELIFYVPTGEAGGRLRETRIPMSQGVAGWVATQRQSIIVNDVHSDPRFLRNVDAETGFRTKNILCVPLLAQGRLVGVLEVLNKEHEGGFTEDDKNWLETLANQAAIALENARLYQNLRMEQERIISAQEEVRHQLARDLHDGPAQMLSLISMNVDMSRQLLERGRYDTVRSELDLLDDLAHQASREIRTLLFELRPVILESRGLIEALRAYHQQLKSTFHSTLHLELEELPFELVIQAASNIFSTIQESINNIRKHAKAENVWVRVWLQDDFLHFEIEDDGVGFDITATQANYAERGSFGLLNMHERIEVLGGRLSIVSPCPRSGKGVLIHGQAPVENIREH